ncbi:branched-chain amino acid ABC transporter permease [Streptomyces sp. HNM0645]|uniref:branched-chain amino acid ABC transporter permease n=1 Tax=Streptomyces sp. HNM0645 TaxID=2782343 RepID=UPI0024B70F91|nr:branched-chain amino acid ABC transporter permease [Streptomyces sp. HNM0645]MDI9888365.1 branched-chain amino acid ABC transporter permease [Streptomyces sp. HNM0645]
MIQRSYEWEELVDIPGLHDLVQATVTGLLLGGLFALTALGLSLVVGVMRLVNLVHGEIALLGGYASLLLLNQVGLDPLLGLPLIAAVVALLAVPLQRLLLQPLSRHGSEAPLLTTFALSVIAQNVIILWFTGNTQSIDRSYTRAVIRMGDVTVPAIYLISFGISVLACICVHLLITRSGFGRRLRAASEDPVAASVVGVRVGGLHTVTYALAAGVAAIGGALLGMCFSFTPTSGVNHLLTGFIVVVLGGLGSVKGTLLAGTALGVVESWGAAFASDGYRLFVGLLLLLAVLTIRPQGLFGRSA